MNIRRPILIMIGIFSSAVFAMVALDKTIIETWNHNPVANTAILSLLVVALLYTFYTALMLWRGLRQWLRLERDPTLWRDDVRFKGVMSFFNGRVENELNSPSSERRDGVIDSFADGLAMRARLAEYMAGLLIGLGLLGTFIGLMMTMGSIGGVLKTLNADGDGGVQAMLESLSVPLSGMSAAFSASLMGLLGSLMMGAVAQCMSDANDSLVQRLRGWSQRHDGFNGESLSRSVVSVNDDNLAPAFSRLAVDIRELTRMAEVRSAVTDARLVACIDLLADIHKEQVSQRTVMDAHAKQVPELLTKMLDALAGLAVVQSRQSDSSFAVRDSVQGLCATVSLLVASNDESRIAVTGTVNALADSMAAATQHGQSMLRKMDLIEAALVSGATQLQSMTQSVVAAQHIGQEMVRQISMRVVQQASVATQQALHDDVNKAQDHVQA